MSDAINIPNFMLYIDGQQIRLNAACSHRINFEKLIIKEVLALSKIMQLHRNFTSDLIKLTKINYLVDFF